LDRLKKVALTLNRKIKNPLKKVSKIMQIGTQKVEFITQNFKGDKIIKIKPQDKRIGTIEITRIR